MLVKQVVITEVFVFKGGTRVKLNYKPSQIWYHIPGAIFQSTPKMKKELKAVVFPGIHDPDLCLQLIKTSPMVDSATTNLTMEGIYPITTSWVKKRSYMSDSVKKPLPSKKRIEEAESVLLKFTL